MKYSYFLSIALVLSWMTLFTFPALAQQKNKKPTALEEKANHLRKYADKIAKGEDKAKYEKLFFETFPNSFPQFVELYGFSAGKAGLLETEFRKHVSSTFNYLQSIDSVSYYTRLIQLGIGGKWEADGINALQLVIRYHTFMKTELMFKLLEKYSDAEIESFWYFFYDAPIPREDIFPKLLPFEASYPHVYKLMGSAFWLVRNAHQAEE